MLFKFSRMSKPYALTGHYFGMQGAVAEIPGIRDVHPDSKISQGLKWKLPSEGPMHGICSEDGSVQKKPGR